MRFLLVFLPLFCLLDLSSSFLNKLFLFSKVTLFLFVLTGIVLRHLFLSIDVLDSRFEDGVVVPILKTFFAVISKFLKFSQRFLISFLLIIVNKAV